MELFPIIKLALTVFTILASIVIVVSYIIYKMKGSNPKKGSAPNYSDAHRAVVHVKEVEVGNGHSHMAHAPVQHQAAHIEQQQQAQIRRKTVKIQKPIVRPRERFKVVNQQQLDIRQQIIVDEKPFYHPRTAETKRQIISRKSFSLIENYSNGGEKLHKLNLAPNFS